MDYGERLKFLVIVGDGMADYPIPKLGNHTPLQMADTPNMDYLSRNGRIGLLRTIPEGLEPSSDTANLSILGYDPCRYQVGRGALEAASQGIPLAPADVVFRCNLVTEKNGYLEDYSAGQISTAEAFEIIKSLKRSIRGTEGIDLYRGVGYRHLLVMRGDPFADQVQCVAPHHAQGRRVNELLPTPRSIEAENAAAHLTKIMLDSRRILEDHRINRARKKAGKKPGNMLWPWGPGKKPSLPSFEEVHGVKGSVISGVDLVKGIARLISMRVIEVPGATGYPDTNYENKAEYALQELEKTDLTFIHVEAPDEASHEGNCELKIRTIEDLDRRLLGKIMDGLEDRFVISVLPDHYTSLRSLKHTGDPVPFLVFASENGNGDGYPFDEASAAKGSLGLIEGKCLIPLMLEAGKRITLRHGI